MRLMYFSLSVDQERAWLVVITLVMTSGQVGPKLGKVI